MFKNLFKKNKNEQSVYCPVNGNVYKIEDVPDEVFAQKMLGDGFAVSPTDGNIYSPISGKIVSLFPTKHAIGIESDKGLQILVHMGINTVELKGVPFDIKVKEGDKVDQHTQLATVDLKYLREKEVHNDIIVVFTNMEAIKTIEINNQGRTNANELIGSYETK